MFQYLKKSFFSLLFVLFFSCAFAEKTSFDALYRYKLDNGLELFVAENNSAPLAYIEIAVRAGAVTQTVQNAGLFHLYEHMLFKGNEKYANQQEFTKAENRLGAIDENGSTGVDRVNYYFTVPSAMVQKGLEFWSYALRTPKIDGTELENEKAVVLSEIKADFTDPAHIRAAALFKNLFPEEPFRLSPSGKTSVVQNATEENLREIQENYYIPSNSAIFVGGDVKHDEIFEYVKQIFGDWQNPSAGAQPLKIPSKTPLSKDKKLVFVDPGAGDDMIHIGYYLRGPDGECDSSDTYAADVWTSIVSNPNGSFSKAFVENKKLAIPESSYVGASYTTRRASGIIGFYGAMLSEFAKKENSDSSEEPNYSFSPFEVSSSKDFTPADKADEFLSAVKKQAALDVTKDTPLSIVIQQFEDSRTYELESAKSILASLSFFWSACGSDYFFSYDENIAKVTEASVNDFVQKYITSKKGVLIVSVSPALWKEYKGSFASHGYHEITKENAFQE